MASETGSVFEGLSEYQARFLRQYPCPQMFAVVSWGCAATWWLASVLGRHPDLYCVHAANHAWHVLGGCERLDGVPYLRVIGSQAFSWVAAGDVHGVNRHHIPELRRVFGDQFNAAVVVREPMARRSSLVGLFRQYEEAEHWDLSHLDPVIARTGVTLPSGAYRWRFFVHAANMLNAIVEEVALGKVYRSEDLTRNADTLGDFVDEITRGKVRPSGEWLRSAIETPKLNAHAERRDPIELDDWQVDVIRKVVSPRAWELYEQLGYPPVELASRSSHQVQDDTAAMRSAAVLEQVDSLPRA